MYSPNTPMLISCTPPMKQIILVMLAQPGTASPISCTTIDQITAQKLNKAIPHPIPVIRCKGFTLRLVIPSNANVSIFFSG